MSSRSLFAALAFFCACSTREPAPEIASAPVLAPPGSPLAGMTTPSREAAQWRGVVDERLVAGGYTYLAVNDGASQRWVAVMGPGEPAGTAVVVHAFGTKQNFHSPRLDRDFDELVFASVEHDATAIR